MDTSEAAVQYRIQTWINIFADCKQSGMTVQQYCDANQLSRDSYYYWYKKIRAMTLKQAAPSIVPIGTTNPVMEQSSVPKTQLQRAICLFRNTRKLQIELIEFTTGLMPGDFFAHFAELNANGSLFCAYPLPARL